MWENRVKIDFHTIVMKHCISKFINSKMEKKHNNTPKGYKMCGIARNKSSEYGSATGVKWHCLAALSNGVVKRPVKLLSNGDVKWQYNYLSSNELKENFKHIRHFDKTMINKGYYCSSCDPFLLLITHLFNIELIHNYCGNSIIYSSNNPRKKLIFFANSHHFW